MAEFAIKRRRCLLCAQPLAERSAKAYPRSREFAALQPLGETCRTFRSRTMSDRSPEPAHDRDARHGSGRSPTNDRGTPTAARHVPCRTGRARQRSPGIARIPDRDPLYTPSPSMGEGWGGGDAEDRSMVKKAPSAGAGELARNLRRDMTKAEQRLWQMLRSRQTEDCRFRRQVPIGGFIADFACHAARLIVEIDGGQHDPSSESEASRTRFLEGE